MDDLAPFEPARTSARIWCAVVGLGFVIFGTLPLFGIRAGGLGAKTPLLVLGTIALVAALSRVTYRQRAVAMVVLGLLFGLVGLHGTGKLETAIGGAGWSLTRLVPAVSIAAALLFRARYRAYKGARVFLGAALVSCIPFVLHASISFSEGFGLPQVGSLIALLAVASSLSGFMGAETTGAGAYLASTIIIAFAVELAFYALFGPSAVRTAQGIFDILIASVAFAGAATLAALGLFQIVAWRFAADARRIDLHARAEPSNERKDDSGLDWSTR